MADALLGIVIENLTAFVRYELATFLGVEELTQKLSGNLTTIRAVLKDAEEKQITSHAVKDWLKKLTDATLVLDDILDECSGHNNYITHFNPKNILARRDIGKRMKKVATKIDAIAEERIKFGLLHGIMEFQQNDDEWRITTPIITEPKVYGREQDIEKVVEFLVRCANDNEELSIYSITGIGGFGKTTLAQQVFNDERVSTLFELKIWVCVSNDFSMMKILRSIIESTTGKSPDLSSLESMQKKVQEIFLSKRVLLVLDDVWNEDQEKWNKFKYLLQRGNRTKGASILVTTRLENVASIMGTHLAHHLEGLSHDDNWSLFKQHAFGPNEGERVELVEIGNEIVRRCVGSPLAAKVLGSLLRYKSEEHQWLSIKESKFWNLSEDNHIMSALRLSYFNLKPSLRSCFSFFAVFPKDFVMVKEELIHLWMSNGFISSRGNLEVEHVGDEVWNELYQRSFFQEVKIDEIGNITFKIHDFVHDLAQSIMGEECVTSKAKNMTNLSCRVRHIGLLDKLEFHYDMIPFKKFESLRTFLEFGPPSHTSNLFPPTTTLRALHTNSFHLSSLKYLTHLRYLNLYRSIITTLPESVCRLQKLQILKLEDCPFLLCIPNKLTQLQDLRHLVIKNCMLLKSMPSNIGVLKCLKTLSIFIVDSKTRFGLAELRDMQLGGKLLIKGLENVKNEKDAREANLAGKKDLNRLYLSWGSYATSQGTRTDDAERVLEALEPHSSLNIFGMKGYGGIHFPQWMKNTSFLEGLVELILYDCKNCEQLPPLGKLPCLAKLFVSGMRDVKYIDDDLYESTTKKAFVSLKELNLQGLPNLERMLKAEGVEMLPQLFHLNILGVPKLTLPSLPSVRTLEVTGNGQILLNSLSSYHFSDDVGSFPTRIMLNMPNLKALGIRRFDKLKVLPDELGNFSDLEILNVSYCDELESFSNHVSQGLSSLQDLTIFMCPKFKSLSGGIGHLTCLEKLEIFGCPQLVLSNMNSLTSLRHAIITGYLANSRLPEGFEGIPSLQNLTLSWFNSLTSLPEQLGAMTSLQKLEISMCEELRSLPDSFQQLKNLNELHIEECPKLEKQLKKRTGTEWRKIPHVPELDLVLSGQVETFYERLKRSWQLRRYSLPDVIGDEFDSMVDFY